MGYDIDFLNPWENPGQYEQLFSKKVILSGLLDRFRIRSGHQKDQAVTGNSKLSAPPRHPLGRGEGLETGLVIDKAYIMEPP